MSQPAHYDVLWAIMEDAELSAAAKCVATVLLLKYRNHDTGRCNPGFAALARRVGRTRRPVISALNELKERGWIDWDGTGGGSQANTNNFRFFLNPEPVLQTAPVSDTAPVLQTAPTSAVDSTGPVLQTAHEPSKNQLEPRRAKKFKKESEGVMVKTDTPLADKYQRWWRATGQKEPAYSRRTGCYISPLPPLPPEWREAAA